MLVKLTLYGTNRVVWVHPEQISAVVPIHVNQDDERTLVERPGPLPGLTVCGQSADIAEQWEKALESCRIGPSEPREGPVEPIQALWACQSIGCTATLQTVYFRTGHEWTPETLASYGRRKHKMQLCWEHYKEASEAKRRSGVEIEC